MKANILKIFRNFKHSKVAQFLKRLFYGFLKFIYEKFFRHFVLKYIKKPENIISVVFQELSPVSECFIETALCCSFNARKPTSEKIISNYCQGAVLFGKHESESLLWKIPSERAIITKESAHLPRKKRKYLEKNDFEIRFNSNFIEVVEASKRLQGTWITKPLIELYEKLYEDGFGWSVEAYHQKFLVGGMWGIKVGGVLGGMSIFHSVDQAGSVLMSFLVERLLTGYFPVLDCGAPKPHFSQYGAITVSRDEFVEVVAKNINYNIKAFY